MCVYVFRQVSEEQVIGGKIGWYVVRYRRTMMMDKQPLVYFISLKYIGGNNANPN
jgi:hypothetical protein